jgi:hypothetical protein
MVAVAAWPQLLGLVGGASERVGVDTLPSRGWAAASVSVLIVSLGFVAPVAVWLLATYLGGGRALVSGNGRGWTAAIVVLMGLAAWLLATADGLAVAVTVPWYSGPWRLLLNVNALALPLAGVGLALTAGGIERLGRSREWPPRLVHGLGAGAVAVVVAAGASASVEAHAFAYRGGDIVNADTRQAIKFLSQRVPAGERVLNGGGGSRWMFALGGVDPLLGIGPGGWTSAEWEGRRRLLSRAGEAGSSATVDAELDRWRISYAIVGDPTLTRRPRVDAAGLANAPGWREVFRSGDVVVYERLATG